MNKPFIFMLLISVALMPSYSQNKEKANEVESYEIGKKNMQENIIPQNAGSLPLADAH